jgi:NAD(P)-dependent dehydrogenase (short-subunit alcohol dehydrogenase family)
MLLRREFGDNGVKTQLADFSDRGPIDTPMVRKSKETAQTSLLPMIPLGREGQADEVAELICWLLCDRSSYITGTVQSIDGGWAC